MGDFLVEIGPGNGELTLPLIKKGGFLKLIAIEKDKDLAATLKKYENDHFTVQEGDVLKKFPEIALENSQKMIVFGNLPYYATGKIFRMLWENQKSIKRGVFMVQKEVAERMMETPGAMNRLAAFVTSWSEPHIAFFVPREDFSPKPKVDSAIVVLTPKKNGLPEKLFSVYEQFVRVLFAQPRKTALNNLSEFFNGTTAEKKRHAALFLEKAGVKIDARPQDINISTLIRLAEMLYNESNGAQNT